MSNACCKHPGTRVGGLSRALAVLTVVVLLAATDGCTRNFFRQAADKEVNDILAEKDHYLPWKIQLWHVYPDQRARFADPTNPDRPPMPPDDALTDQLAPHPQQPGHEGVARVDGSGYLEMIKTWDDTNREERKAVESKTVEQNAEAPEIASGSGGRRGPMQELFDGPLTGTQGFLMTLEQSVELGGINSRAYQSIREDLYLGALPVTAQRFTFAWQFAAIEQAVRQWAGPTSLEGHQNNWSLGSTVSASKLFSTGALLTTTFANTTVFNFLKKGNGLSSLSTFNLDLVQPLLRGGGKAVTLEPLTQAERTLLYEIRAYWHFRQQFYLNVVLGTGVPTDLASAAGTAGGTGPISLLAALGVASTDVKGGFVGYLSTLFRELDMAADKKLVVDLEKTLRIYEGYQEGGIFSPLQVDQVRTQLLQARNTVLTDEQFVTNALDQFKLVLGVPVNMPLVLDDTLARPVTRQLDRYYKIIDDADLAFKDLEKQDELAPEKLRGFLRDLYQDSPLVRGTEFRKRIGPLWDKLAKLDAKDLGARQQDLGKQRRKLLDAKTDLEMKGETLSADDARQLREVEFEADLGGLEELLRRYELRSWEKRPKDQQAQDRLKQFRLVGYAAELVLVSARNERFAAVATMWPALPATPLADCNGGEGIDILTADVDVAQDAAVNVALTERMDMMNARAQVVDAWRQLRVTANALMGFFNVQFHVDSVTPATGANPLAFATSRTNAELTLQPQLPLVRLNERNAYRTAIINYQRARRNLITAEDDISAQVRFDVRQLHLFAENYRIQQKVIQLLYSQVENALELIVAPADPDNLKATGTAGAANAAALTNQYLQALSGLNNAQVNMYDIWLSYLATRMQLYVDLERLYLDNRGVWTDESGKSIPGQSPACPAGQPAPFGPVGGIVPGNGLGGTPVGQPAAGNGPVGVPGQPQPRPRFLAPTAGTPLE
jgi:hypothetical protein